MRIKFFFILVSCLFFVGQAMAADSTDLQIKTTTPGRTVRVEKKLSDGRVLLSVSDEKNEPVLGLTTKDFVITLGSTNAQIDSVQPAQESFDVPRNIVLVLDNSLSMDQRKAIEPLLAGVDELFRIVRPIDKVKVVVFTEAAGKMTENIGGRDLHVRTFSSDNVVDLKNFVVESFSKTTSTTVLYEAMLAGLELLRAMPENEPRFLVVFSDGEDINSKVGTKEVLQAAEGLGGGFHAYGIDFMPGPAKDKFLTEFTEGNKGETWKAASASSLVPIFQSVTSRIEHYYVVSFQFPPTGTIEVSPAALTIEEIKTIDFSPMLGYVYFAEGSAEIPAKYALFSGPDQAASFDETRFTDTMEKYYQVLNLIGKRLRDNPQATIVLTGCNANTGPEKGDKELSAKRANAVRDYLLVAWSIAPERIRTEARNLPEKPSSSKLEEGRAENRRVEISSDVPEILAPIRSTYFVTRSDSDSLKFHPTIGAVHGVARWTVTAENSNGIVGSVSGQGEPPAEIQVPLDRNKLKEVATAGDITPQMTIEDSTGQQLTIGGKPITVNFIQTKQLMAEEKGYKIQEKYALILFDFNSDAISAGNQEIVSRIVSRMKDLPQVKAEIVGHTDNIGKEEYNIKLSERRALSVYKLLIASYGEDAAGRITYRGVGPFEPLYDNSTPEARAFNRTVTIILEYTATGGGSGI